MYRRRLAFFIISISLLAFVGLWLAKDESGMAGESFAQTRQAIVGTGAFDRISLTKQRTLLDDVPALQVAGDEIRRYNFFRICAKFERISATLESLAGGSSNPAFSTQEKEQIARNRVFVDSHRDQCRDWNAGVSRDLANARMFAVALDAALAGDENAASCFVLAAWQAPAENTPEYQRVRKAYQRYAPSLRKKGIEAGNWLMLYAVNDVAREEHGLRSAASISPQDSYLFARLAQLGAATRELEARFGAEAADRGRLLSQSTLNELDAKARSLYVSKFSREKVEEQKVFDSCVN